MTQQAEQIRSVHPYGFRSGEWGEILTTVEMDDGRVCYLIAWPESERRPVEVDWWPVEDPSDEREFR